MTIHTTSAAHEVMLSALRTIAGSNWSRFLVTDENSAIADQIIWRMQELAREAIKAAEKSA